MSDFKPMLAGKVKYVKDKETKQDTDVLAIPYPIIVQEKLDGIRCAIVDGKALSRTLKEIPNREIFEYLSKPEFEGLDGELVVGSPHAEDAYRTTVSFVMASDKTDAEWAFYVFDKWDEKGNYVDRYKAAMGVLADDDYPENFRILPYVEVLSQEELTTTEKAFVERGAEGVILRATDQPYKFGRGSGTKVDLVKLKRFEDSEATIIGVVEEFHNANEATTNELGRTQRSSHKENKVGKGTLGALIVTDDDTGVTFQVGTGFDAAQRADFWVMWEQKALFGRTIKYKFFPIGVKEKPRHPVFLGFRDMEIDG